MDAACGASGPYDQLYQLEYLLASVPRLKTVVDHKRAGAGWGWGVPLIYPTPRAEVTER